MIRRRLLSLALLAAALIPASARATPGDSLSVPLFGDRSEALWPLQVGLEVVAVDTGDLVVPRRELVVSDGQHTIFSEVIATPRGTQGFELELMLLAAALTLVFTGPGRIAIEGRRAPAEPATG